MVLTTTKREEGGGEKATVVIWGHVTLVAILVRPARPRAHMLLLLGRLYGGGGGGWGEPGREVAQSLYSSCSSRGRPRLLQARAERTQGKDALNSCHKEWHIVLEQFFFVLEILHAMVRPIVQCQVWKDWLECSHDQIRCTQTRP